MTSPIHIVFHPHFLILPVQFVPYGQHQYYYCNYCCWCASVLDRSLIDYYIASMNRSTVRECCCLSFLANLETLVFVVVLRNVSNDSILTCTSVLVTAKLCQYRWWTFVSIDVLVVVGAFDDHDFDHDDNR